MKLKDHSEIKAGMLLHSISEDYDGDVIHLNGVLQSDVMGFGYTPISELDLEDIIVTGDKN